MSEFLNSQENEKKPIRVTIAELLPRYYETHGDGLRYEVVRSIPIDGHEVAWVKQVSDNYEVYELECVCKFAEGQGGECLPREVAVHLRQQELRQEYIEKFSNHENQLFNDEYSLRECIPEVILDLIKKDKANEFISEQGNGAHFWGGHFYLQTVQEITGADWDEIWSAVTQMQLNKQIQLEGMLVQEYTLSSEPQWDEYCRFTYEDYTGVALLPAHSQMDQNWQITILAPNGCIISEGINGPHLSRNPDFGPDVADVAEVEALIQKIIYRYLIGPMSQA